MIVSIFKGYSRPSRISELSGDSDVSSMSFDMLSKKLLNNMSFGVVFGTCSVSYIVPLHPDLVMPYGRRADENL